MMNMLRTLNANKSTSLISILGFAAGLAAAMLLLIFIRHELSYDRHWPNRDRIYRLSVTVVENDNMVEFPICLRKAYTELPAQVPGIESAVQIYRTINPEINLNNQRFRNLRFLYVDSTFFQVFRLQAVAGNLDLALQTPDAIVINQRTASKLFGEANPIGKLVTVSEYSLRDKEQLVRVAAVVPDLPKTSHFDFDVLLPMSANGTMAHMGGLEFFTYYALAANVPITATLAEIERVHNDLMLEWATNLGLDTPPGSRLLPLQDIYLYSKAAGGLGPQGDPQAISIFAVLTGLILLIAIANFVNLFLVQSSKRAMQTGIRKTLGATQFQLVRQFMSESFLLSLFALLIALYVVSFLVHPFGELVRRELSMSALLQPQFLFTMIGLFLLTALLAGAYPAWYLSRQQPVQILKGVGSSGAPKQRLRKGIVLLQFAICMLLLTNLLVMHKQMNYMRNKPLGFDAKNVIAYQGLSSQLRSSFPLIKNDLQQFPNIVSVTGSHSRPGQGASGQSMKKFGMPDQSRISIREVRVQPDFLKTYAMQLFAGREFDATRSTDRNAVIINEAAARALGLDEPVGAQVVMFSEPMEVIGVVKDYHYSSLRHPIKPEVFTFYRDQIFTISIRIRSTDPQATIANINQVFATYDANYAPNYAFLQDAFAAMYGDENRLIQLVQAGSILALVLTILGLAAITAITVQQRTKEIGIRKAIGASSRQIVQLLVGSQIISLFVTTCISGFLALWIVRNWLQNYAYRINISFWIFVMTGTTILFIALLVTAVISYRASQVNPVESLRYE